MVGLEVIQNLTLKGPKLRAKVRILVAAPVLIKAILPSIPIKDLGNRIHKRIVFFFRR